MTPDEITITLSQLAGTGSPPQWSCRITKPDRGILLAISGSSDAVLAALRASIDEIDRARAVLAGKPETRQ